MYEREDLSNMLVAELRAIALKMEVENVEGLRKSDLVEAISAKNESIDY